jgi:hypothetical protein
LLVKRLVVSLLLGVFVAGCVLRTLSPEELVAERAEARWQAMLAADYEKAYGFLAPGYRSRVSLDNYRARFAGRTKWLEASLQRVTCEEDVCEARFTTKYRFLGSMQMPPMDAGGTATEKWVLTQGKWWHVPRR